MQRCALAADQNLVPIDGLTEERTVKLLTGIFPDCTAVR